MKWATKKKNKKSSSATNAFNSRSTYKIEGKYKEEPPGGWIPPSAQTETGKHLVKLYHSGLDVTLAPTAIYQQYPILRNVKYGSKSFGSFKNKCVKQYQRECNSKKGHPQPQRQQQPKVTFRSKESIIPSSSSSSGESSMSSSSSDSDDDSSRPSTVFGRRRDAPDCKEPDPVPLVDGEALNARNKQVHVPFYCAELSYAYLTFIQLMVGAVNYTAMRNRKKPNQIIFKWDSGALASENGVDLMFNNASRTDHTLSAVRSTVIEHNGRRAAADDGSHPRDFMIVNLEKKVESATAPWTLTGADGYTMTIEGTSFVDGYFVCYWKKASSDAGMINRVGGGTGFTPQRATFNPGNG